MEGMNNSIKINVILKRAGNITKKVKPCPFWLGKAPHTFRELIEESVKTSVSVFNDRTSDNMPLTEEQLDGMREIGKFAFGVHYNSNSVDAAKAIETAVDAVRDGLVRVFMGNDELTDLEKAIEVTEGDVFTFIRLTMLSGRMW